VLRALGEWAAAWAFPDPDPSELDAVLLMRWISRDLAQDQLPAQRTVIRINFAAPVRRRFWLVLEPGDVSICHQDPGFDANVVVDTDVATLYRIYSGRSTLPAELRAGTLSLTGPPRLVRAFPRWFAWSKLAPAVRAAAVR
jgi:hypothetical protein